MRKTRWCILLIAFISAEVFALETVNLVKSHDFESNIDFWTTESGSTNPGYSEVTAVLQCEEMIHEGSFSAMSNTINRPEDVPPDTRDTTVFYQVFPVTKQLADFDSLIFVYYDSCNLDSVRHGTFSADLMAPNAAVTLRYHFFNDNPFATPAEVGGRKIFSINVELNNWTKFSSDLYSDFAETKGVSPDQFIERFILRNFGMEVSSGEYYGWWGQKVYWDDIRLMGYADYDVGIKEILSGDELEVDSPYTPIARIKNFGREDVEEFNVIAEVWDGESLIYEETISHTLPGDTEDTLEFPPFTPTYMTVFTLTIRTEMITPAIDECDEDDQLSKIIGTAGIADDPDPQGISFCLYQPLPNPFTDVATIRYSLPNATHVTIKVFDVSGRLVTSLVDGQVEAGIHEMQWTGCDDLNRRCSSGVYFVRFDTPEYHAARKMVLIK